MWTPTAFDDLLISATTRLLAVPLHEVYALLWRAGVLEILETRAPEAPADDPTGESWPPPPPSRRQPAPALAPTPLGPPVYSRATG
nr:Rv1535 domain-containing protein [Mycobacterium talmoniae]